MVKQDNYKEVSLSMESFEAGEGRNALGHWKKVKEQAIFCAVTDKEYILRTILEFRDVATEDCLNLDTFKLKDKYFRQCLGADVRTAWDNTKDGKPENLAGWNASLWSQRSEEVIGELQEEPLHDSKNFQRPHHDFE